MLWRLSADDQWLGWKGSCHGRVHSVCSVPVCLLALEVGGSLLRAVSWIFALDAVFYAVENILL